MHVKFLPWTATFDRGLTKPSYDVWALVPVSSVYWYVKRQQLLSLNYQEQLCGC